jgi:stringent starvation protein B
VLNLAPAAIQNLEMTNEFVSFSARFNGVGEQIFVPVPSLLAVYARENGEGMMFPSEEDNASTAADGEVIKPVPKSTGPTLKVIK